MHKKVTKRTREENKGETNTREVKSKRRVSMEEGARARSEKTREAMETKTTGKGRKEEGK